MTNVKVVIGANFGDEGKGLVTDYLCHTALKDGKSCINVLTNGGAQRAHTVETADGRRVIFSHFGSGTLAGADTYFSSYYIVNPMIFKEEYLELHNAGIHTLCYCDPMCQWSTPYDMLVNQMIEESREEARHGSCGCGIWETTLRYRRKLTDYGIFFFNSFSDEKKREILTNLRDGYFLERLKENGIISVPTEWKSIYYSPNMIERFISDTKFFCSHVIKATTGILRDYNTVVMENGQGLLLDQSLEFYGDNTTPSNTGSINAYNLTKKVFGNSAYSELFYVSRTYMTRHGAGRFVTECDKNSINPNIVDKTNVPNPFQGTLRYGELKQENLFERVKHDSEIFVGAKPFIVFTHTNEYDNIDYDKFNGLGIYKSDGKTRESVKII